MLRKVCDYIKQNKMVEMGDRIVVGVSGGADSVCLLYVLFEICIKYEIKIIVVHVNHGIRGIDADRDEQFVKELCSKLDIEYHSFYADVKKIAREDNLTEEEAGRQVRYQAFYEVSKQNKCNKIAIAHNRNDNAETVLFHLFRGSGMKGLTGIEPIRSMKTDSEEITVIRPLLCIERQEIEEYLKEKKISYQTDSTNLLNDYSRNKIRNQVLTYVTKEINQNAIKHIDGAASQLRETWEFLNKYILQRYAALVNREGQSYLVTTQQLKKEDIVIQRGIIRKILENLAGNLKDLEAKHVEQIISLYHKQVGRYIHLPYDIIARRGYNEIEFYIDKNRGETGNQVELQMEPMVVTIPGKLFLSKQGVYLETSVIDYKKNSIIPKNCCTKWFDYDKIENAVVIRTRNEGDYIQINHLGGRKKIKDYFIDQKIPKEERDIQLLVTDGSHVMWVLGNGDRMSEKYKVGETTSKILLMKLFNMEEKER